MEELELPKLKKVKSKSEVSKLGLYTNIQDKKLLVYNYLYGYCKKKKS